MALFSLGKQSIPTPQEEYDKILGVGDENTKGNIVEIDIELLDEISDQKFKIHNENISALVESINKVGVLDPLIVREKKNGRYDIISGRHRARACKILTISTAPCIIKDCTVDEARYILLCTNLNRNNDLSPSELAYGYREQTDLLKKISSKNPSVAQIANESQINKRTVQRYIRLTYLNRQLLNLVDNKSMSLISGVELSYISDDNQRLLFTYILNSEIQISQDQAKALRALELSGGDTPLVFDNTVLDSVFFLNNDTTNSVQVRHDVVSEDTEEERKSEKVGVIKDKKQTQKNEPKAEKKEKINNSQNTNIPEEIVLQFVKQNYGNKSVYGYYVFNVPTQEQAIKYLFKKSTATRFRGAAVICKYQNTDCVLPLADVDTHIRKLIVDEKLISKKEILECLINRYHQLNL